MKQRGRILIAILLACVALFLSACTQSPKYKAFIEEELIPTLKNTDEAYSFPNSYFMENSELDCEVALAVLGNYIWGDPDYTKQEAKDAFKVIEGYIEFSRDELSDLLAYTRKYYVD